MCGYRAQGLVARDHVVKAARLSPDVIRLMATVFDDVARERGLAPRSDPICELVAEAILDCARRGCRDCRADAPMRIRGAWYSGSASSFGSSAGYYAGHRDGELSGNHQLFGVLMVCPLQHPPPVLAVGNSPPGAFFFGDCGECLAVNPSAINPRD